MKCRTYILLCCFVCENFRTVLPQLSDRIKEDDGKMEPYIKTIFEKIETQRTLVINLDPKYIEVLVKHIQMKVLITNKFDVSVHPRRVFDLHVLTMNTIDDLKTFYKVLTTTKTINYRAKYLLVYSSGFVHLRDIFELSWRNSVLNVNMIVENQDDYEQYTYFPYVNGSCGEAWDPVRVELSADEIFPEKVPSDLRGCLVRLTASQMKPYTLDIDADKTNVYQAGVELTIMYNVMKLMNVNATYEKSKHADWGYLRADGTLSYSYGAVYNNHTDIMFGMVVANETLDDYFDNGAYILVTEAVWVVPMARQAPQWENLSAIFQAVVWFVILVSFIINGTFWWLVGRKKETSNDYNDLTLCLMGSFYILLQGAFSTPASWILRFSLIVWSIASVLLFTAHQCELTGILTSPLYEHQIATIDELLNSHLKYGFHPNLRFLYDKRIPRERTILENSGTCDLSLACFDRTAYKRDFGFMKNKRAFLYIAAKNYIDKNGKLLLYNFKEREFLVYTVMVVRKGYPLLDRMNRWMLLMHSNGLIEKWDKDIVARKYQAVQEELEPLSLSHLQAAFYLWTLGLLVSTCAFVSEKYREYQLLKKTATANEIVNSAITSDEILYT